MATLFVDKVDPQSGTSLEIGSSGDTITIPSGCTITNNGTQTGFGGANTPYFQAYQSGSAQTIGATWTKVQINDEVVDSANAYDNSTNYRFTPQTAGKYFCYIQLTASNDAQNLKRVLTTIRKNGSNNYQDFMMPDSSNNTRKIGVFQGLVLDLNGSTDYFEAAASLDGTSGNNSTDYSRIGAYKLIGA